jgi:hypothetical protein
MSHELRMPLNAIIFDKQGMERRVLADEARDGFVKANYSHAKRVNFTQPKGIQPGHPSWIRSQIGPALTLTPGSTAAAPRAKATSRPKTNEPPAMTQPPSTFARKCGDGGATRSVESTAASKAESTSATAPVAAVADEARTESWDTENFRLPWPWPKPAIFSCC